MVSFSPMLNIPNGTYDVDFYTKALGAELVRTWKNDDGSIHVAEFSIGGTLFHLHQESPEFGNLTPAACQGVTCSIGLFTDDVDAVIQKALSFGAKLLSPAQDYDYGYRQGDFRDPFGHKWVIQKII